MRFDGGSPDVSAVARMSQAMAPRGPDGAGVFAQGAIAVAHRRLKIIDLSENAQQPMVDSQLGLGIVFNGCIYNYKQLRAELESLDYRFFSHGDTEVILKAYHAWGHSCVDRLQGMFAFAIWERDSGRMVWARDRLGIKPFYYAEVQRSLRFASALPALLAAGDVDTSIDPVALHHYLSFHAVVPAPHTIVNGVRKLPPATVRIIEADGRSQDIRYWMPSYETPAHESDLEFEDWQTLVLAALRKAVKRRLVADVPVGVLLSGGLDSSLIVGLLAEQGQRGINTFSVGFEAVGDVKGDEFAYSDLIAKSFDTDHHKLFVNSDTLLPSLADCVQAMCEPMVSHDVIGFYLLSKKVSEHVKVVQSGQGADEVFAGYHWYPPLMESDAPVDDYSRVFCDRSHAAMKEVLADEYYRDDYSRRFVQEHFAVAGAPSAIDKALRLDTNVMLVNDPVKRVDNMTMAWGLEARVPFLDHELVELAARMPAQFKVCDGGKGVLKAIGRKVIPSEVIDRPKGYFPVPALKHLEGPYLDFVSDILGQAAAKGRGIFRDNYVSDLLADPAQQITPLGGSKLWQIALLEFWLQTHGI